MLLFGVPSCSLSPSRVHGFKQVFCGGRGGRGEGEAIQRVCGMLYRNPDLRDSKNVC